jgi:hypothetical protein
MPPRRIKVILAVLILSLAGGCGHPIAPAAAPLALATPDETAPRTAPPADEVQTTQKLTYLPAIVLAQPANDLPKPIPAPQPSLDFFGIDFANRQKPVTIRIFPPNRRVNGGKPIEISFLPGKRCVFGDHRACVFNYLSLAGGNVIFLSVHSGVGGEADPLRHALEGTGIGQPAFSLKQVRAAMKALGGASVTITQGAATLSGLSLDALARIPAARLEAYFDAPIAAALTRAEASNPGLGQAIDPAQPLIVLETCGWKMPSEPWAEGVTSTTGSVYLGLIQAGP